MTQPTEWEAQVIAAADTRILAEIDPDGVYTSLDLEPALLRQILVTWSRIPGSVSIAAGRIVEELYRQIRAAKA